MDISELKKAFKYFALLTFLTGFLYPILTTVIGQTFYSKKTKGSLFKIDGLQRGSYLIGQKFTRKDYFWGRPSACDYDPMNSSASQLSPTSKVLKENILKRKKEGFENEMLYASASGLDPHISPESALLQIPRVLAARGKGENREYASKLKEIIRSLEEGPDFYLFGQRTINVLKLNLALDALP